MAGAAQLNDLRDAGEDRARSAYGDNYARMAALKTKCDPANLLGLDQATGAIRLPEHCDP